MNSNDYDTYCKGIIELHGRIEHLVKTTLREVTLEDMLEMIGTSKNPIIHDIYLKAKSLVILGSIASYSDKKGIDNIDIDCERREAIYFD